MARKFTIDKLHEESDKFGEAAEHLVDKISLQMSELSNKSFKAGMQHERDRIIAFLAGLQHSQDMASDGDVCSEITEGDKFGHQCICLNCALIKLKKEL